MVSISAPWWVLSFAFERKFLEPRRLRSWSAKTEPFVHAGKRGLLFELHPREFIDREIYVEGIFEKRFLDFLRAYFTRHPGRIALDIGCNIGNHCCYLADTFQEIHAFDPNPVATARFRKNIELNGIGNVRLNMVGLSDARSTLHLNVNRDGNLGNSMLSPECQDDSMPVPVITGDDYVRENIDGRIDFMKIDVEGHELAVLRGLRQTIADHRPMIAFEHHGQDVPAGGFRAFAETMPGYTFLEARYRLDDGSAVEKLQWHLAHCGRPDLLRVTEPEPRTYDAIIACPDEEMVARLNAI